MTAIATAIGSVPLLVATGPGAAARQSLGTAIVGGMCISTVLSLFVVPVLYIVIKTLAERYKPSSKPVDELNHKEREDGLVHYPMQALADSDRTQKH
jgi:hydrophobic/amphiphilic exporter-1 (mainly G- bacteria), HAE1 family